MKIFLLSDLHFEFDTLSELSGGDVLLLAGDVCEASNLSKFWSFKEEISEKFRDVYVIAGNHEHYNEVFQNTIKYLKDDYRLFPNIHVLDNEMVHLSDDWVLWAGTLWTDFNNQSISSMVESARGINDFKLIKYNGKAFIPNNAINEYQKSLALLKGSVEYFPLKKFIVMTHHAPSQKSVHEYFKNYPNLNGAFVNDLDQFIWNHPNIKYWVHGHTHNSFDYKIANCRVMCNPKGYGKENKYFFKKDFYFEV